MLIGWKTKKLFRVKNRAAKRILPKWVVGSSKFLVSKYIKLLEFLKRPKTFVINKGTKHKKNHMEGLNLKN